MTTPTDATGHEPHPASPDGRPSSTLNPSGTPQRVDRFDRRRALRLLAGAGLGVGVAGLAAACSSGSSGAASGSAATEAGGSAAPSTTAGATTTAASCTELPEETAGPYPADGSNGPDVLSEGGAVRSDIRSSFGSMTGTADGVPLTIRLRVLDAATCEPAPGAAVYLWHCDREGRYSLYSEGAQDQNYLRGVQAADDEGWISFTSIFPACYEGRWPHVHFEVFDSLDQATDSRNAAAISQLAFPEATCDAVYATEGYESSVRTLSRVSLTSDMVFRDGSDTQTAAMAGDPASGYTATLDIPVAFRTAG